MNNKFQEIKDYLIKHLTECEDMIDIGNLIGYCIKNKEVLNDFQIGINHGLQDLNKLPVYIKIIEGDYYKPKYKSNILRRRFRVNLRFYLNCYSQIGKGHPGPNDKIDYSNIKYHKKKCKR